MGHVVPFLFFTFRIQNLCFFITAHISVCNTKHMYLLRFFRSFYVDYVLKSFICPMFWLYIFSQHKHI